MASNEELLKKVETLQNLLLSYATGGTGGDSDYKQLRGELLAEPMIRDQLPRFVSTCRDLYQFWQFIKLKFSTYAERRKYLWQAFGPIMDTLEMEDRAKAPSDKIVTDTLAKVDSDTVHEAWRRALERRLDDADGAITAARSLIETVCKHILDDAGITYDNNMKLPKLYRLVTETLNIAPSEHSEPILKQILGGAVSIVEGLGALRNILGDAHGKGSASIGPQVSHAELAVNLAGTISTFLIAMWERQQGQII